MIKEKLVYTKKKSRKTVQINKGNKIRRQNYTENNEGIEV